MEEKYKEEILTALGEAEEKLRVAMDLMKNNGVSGMPTEFEIISRQLMNLRYRSEDNWYSSDLDCGNGISWNASVTCF